MTDDQPRLIDDTHGEATLRGVVRSVVYRASDAQFAVIKLLGLDGRESTVIGDLGNVTEGENVRIAGRWEEHSQHGKRLRALALVPELPSTPEGIQRLIASGFVDGVGAEMARRIVEKFGSGTLDVIQDHPERLREVSGIGKQRASRIQDSFRARRAESEARSFLQAAGMGLALTHKVIKKYGDRTPQIVREDPYQLAIDVPGVGFRTADRIGRQLGIRDDDPRRVLGAVLHTLSEAGDHGHSGLPLEQIISVVTELGVPSDRVDAAIATLVSRKLAVSDLALIYPRPLHRAESSVAEHLVAALRKGADRIDPRVLESKPVTAALEPLHPLQRAAVRATIESPLLVITGGPGTGKTTTVRAIVAVMKAAGRSLQLAAPTGRAARRLTEATGEPAKTLHRLLEWNPRLGHFQRDESSPIAADVVLIDEVSMLDIVLASRVLAALRPGARLVLVGDSDQLPSVGPGSVLADLLATPWIPSVRLTEIFRQAASSAIVQGAYSVLHGEMPKASPTRAQREVSPPNGELFTVFSDDAERAASLLITTVVERIPQAFGLNPLRDVQVLVPTHRGPMGTTELNATLQRALNPIATPVDPSARGAGQRPLVGDKVMQLKNDYELEVWNGDMGRVTARDRDSLTVAMDSRDVIYRGDARDALALAYAATVHKAQGSEYEAVVIGLHMHHFVLLNRALIYTAITRAKRLVVIVGSERALALAVKNARTAERYGALRQRLADTKA